MKDLYNTERLLLQDLAEADDDFMLNLLNSKGWLEFIGDRNVHSKEEAVIYINKIRNNPNINYWVIRLKANNLPIGIVSFIKRNYLPRYDIGFALLPGFEGKGYAFEAAKEILISARQDPQHSTILATTLPHNTSSIKLLKKLGLTFYEEIKVEQEILQVYFITYTFKKVN